MPRPQDDYEPRRTPWYWWVLVNVLALCFAVLSWLLALEVFGRPDVPSNYQILRKLDRAPDFKSYNPKGSPEGRVFAPPGLYGWFFDMGEKRHELLNTLYRRNYLRNFDDAQAVTYAEGTYRVLTTRPFGKEDFLSDGFVIRAEALVRPDDFSPLAPYPVVIEMIMPTRDEQAREQFEVGSQFTLAKAPHLPLVMHVGRHLEQDEPTVQVTLMPIGYGEFQAPSGKSIALDVPEWVRPEGELRFFEPGAGREE